MGFHKSDGSSKETLSFRKLEIIAEIWYLLPISVLIATIGGAVFF